MKIYLAGPMRGKPNFNFPAFDYAAAKLRQEGHRVFSPAERDRGAYGADFGKDNATGDEMGADGKDVLTMRRECFLADTTYICREAEAVAFLPGWEGSKGAVAEAALAVAIGLETVVLGPEYTQ